MKSSLFALAAAAALLTPLVACAQDEDAPAQGGASQQAAAAGPNCAVTPTAPPTTGDTTVEGQMAMLESDDPELAANKRLVWDMWRTLLNASHIDRAGEFIHEDYIQHNPMANTGLAGMQGFFRAMGRQPIDIPAAIPEGVVDVVAEGDKVVIVFPRTYTDGCDREYSTTWFDMFRIEDGIIVEHWDPATRP
jgi:predicted SnoaL-like aldol condensation-catalyzing enzyme